MPFQLNLYLSSAQMLMGTMTSSSRENVLISKGMFPEDTELGVDVDDVGGFSELSVELTVSKAVGFGANGKGSNGASRGTD